MNKAIGLQPDGSIIGADGQVMSSQDRANLLSQVSLLPINPFAGQIQDAVRESIVTIISAETGSGKTSQVPQYLRKLWNRRTQISIAEPRVIATVNAANRVSKELIAKTADPYFSVGHRVGYRTGKGSLSAPGSELLFVTDGLQLMRQLVSGRNPDILIADEVHNFSVSTEFLLAHSRRIMQETKNNMRLVLMSATLDQELVSSYFSDITKDIPTFNIPGRTFPVEKYFVGDNEFLSSIIDLTQRQVGKIAGEEYKNILVFVEGKKKIEMTVKFLKDKLFNYEILPLHSEIPIAEQRLVMDKGSKPRIIVATNIAQESITIPYINAVVDNGFGKVLRVNENGIPELRKEHISRADGEQRAGRAGRVMDGEYVRANSTALGKLKMFPDAEIENITIEKFILGALAAGFDPIKYLNTVGEKTFIHKPNKELLKMSYDNLIKLGAITTSHKVTVLGKRLLVLPLEPYIGKMLIEGIKRGCGANMVDICAIINHKGFFAKSELWKKFVPGKYHNDSDLIAHRELLNLITTREPLDSEMLHNFHYYGLDKAQIEEYKKISNTTKDKMLFEVIDLTLIGVKSKVVYEIISTRKTLTERLESNQEELLLSEDFTEISKSILAGMLNNIYTWVKKSKKFKHHIKGEFQKPLTSILAPSSKFYFAGLPFIIGGEEEMADLHLLSFITRVESEWIEEVGKLFIEEDFTDFGFSEKKVGITTRGYDKMGIKVTAKRRASIGGLKLPIKNEEVSKEKLKQVLFYHWLPEFLVKENLLIKKFIRSHNKGKFNTEKFKELLIIICKKDYKKFELKNFEKFRNDFINDTQILFYFEESKEPAIIEFLANPYKEEYKNGKENIKAEEIEKQHEIDSVEEIKRVEAELKDATKATKKLEQIEKRQARLDRRKACEPKISPKLQVTISEPTEPKPIIPPLQKKEGKKIPRRLKKIERQVGVQNEVPKVERRIGDRRRQPRQNTPEINNAQLIIEKYRYEIDKYDKVIKKMSSDIFVILDETTRFKLAASLEEIEKYINGANIDDFDGKFVRNELTKLKKHINKLKPKEVKSLVLTQESYAREIRKIKRFIKELRAEIFKIDDENVKIVLRKELNETDKYIKETKIADFSLNKVREMLIDLKNHIDSSLPKEVIEDVEQI